MMIEDFQVLAKAAGLPCTDEMLINYGWDIVQKIGDFEMGLMAWFRADEGDKTWANFKEHFTQVHRDLRKARGQTMRQTNFQAHIATQEIADSISDLRAKLRTSISALAHNPPSNYNQSTTASMSSLTPSANLATTSNLLQLILQLQNQLITSKPASSNASTNPLNVRSSVIIQTNTVGCTEHAAIPALNAKTKNQGIVTMPHFANKVGGSTFLCDPVDNN